MKSPRRFVADFSEEATLRDGSTVVLRLLRPEDRTLLSAGFEQLSAESRYRRFFCAKTKLSDAELDYLCDIDGESHFAIGAVREREDGSVEPLGIARFVRLVDEPKVAEAAIAVIDAMQGQGLGKILLHRLAEAAVERSVHRFRCTVLAGNDAMQQLFRELDPEARIVDESTGVRRIDLSLHAPADESLPFGLLHGLERVMAHAARGLIHVRAKRDEAARAEHESET